MSDDLSNNETMHVDLLNHKLLGVKKFLGVTSPKLTLIYGPMFSGKTTKLIEIYNLTTMSINKNKCLVINYALDERYGKNKIITHDGLELDCYSILNLSTIIENPSRFNLYNVDYIFINEGQFFENIHIHVKLLLDFYKKNVIICGLNLDYKKEPFGTMMNLIEDAHEIYKLSGTCATPYCKCPSIYSHRIVKNNSQVLIGSSEYIPLCEKCYAKANLNLDNSEEYLIIDN